MRSSKGQQGRHKRQDGPLDDVFLFGLAMTVPGLRPLVAVMQAVTVFTRSFQFAQEQAQWAREDEEARTKGANGNGGNGSARGGSHSRWSRERAPSSPAEVDAVMESVPPHLRKKAYYALAKVLHPDAGGDEESFKALQAWYDRAEAGA